MEIAIIEYMSLVLFETILAIIMSAFESMENKKKWKYLVLAFIPIALMVMFHDVSIGNDSNTYSELFYALQNLQFDQLFNNQRYEKGYLIFSWILAHIFNSSQWLFIITGLFTCISVFYWVYNYISAPGLFMLLCVEMLTLDSWMSANRQTMAGMILLFAYHFMVQDKKFATVISIIIAMLFHNAAFIFLPAYIFFLLFNKKRNRRFEVEKVTFILVLSTIIIGVAFSGILSNVITTLFPVYSYYQEGVYMNGEARLAVILKLIVAIVMILTPNILAPKAMHRYRQGQIGFTLYLFSLFNVILIYLSLQATIIMRLSGVFALFIMGNYAENIALLKIRYNKFIMITLSIVLFGLYGLIITMYRTPQWQTTYPFHFCF